MIYIRIVFESLLGTSLLWGFLMVFWVALETFRDWREERRKRANALIMEDVLKRNRERAEQIGKP